MNAGPADAEVADRILELLARRDPESSVCPSEVARSLADDWRPLMPQVREVAATMQRAGRLRATQGQEDVDPVEARGPIRLRASRS